MFSLLVCLFTFVASAHAANRTFLNPVIPGWHSDPSCVFVPEWEDTFFCVTSTFILTPGIPIHASKDLVNWRLASHAMNRPTQAPQYNITPGQNDGVFAVTLRYRDGVFYAITFFISESTLAPGMLFKTTDPFDNVAWSDPILFPATSIDPDLFWDDDGVAYVALAGITLSSIDLETGILGPSIGIWQGTGGVFPEGPHIYKKDGSYYLLIAEGGTETGHAVTMARAINITGPYTGYEGNPVLTNRGTDQYFQTVGHADMFQDGAGNWWTCALSTRSGPEWINYPMGREMVITAARWDEGEFPVMTPVRGRESGWKLQESKDVGGTGPFAGEPDIFDFAPGSVIPPRMSFWRWPDIEAYTVSPKDHPNTLRLRPSKVISTGTDPITLIMRLQTDTLFEFNIDVAFSPTTLDEEAGATVFLTQQQHIDLGIVLLADDGNAAPAPHLRLRTAGGGNLGSAPPAPVVQRIPDSWLASPITLSISTDNDTHYRFAAQAGKNKKIVLGSLPATILSGGSGPFTGTLVGAYATANNGSGTTEAYVSRWRYRGIAQKIGDGEFVDSW